MRPATREHHEAILRSFDVYSFSMQTAITAISERLLRDGLSWLSDEQLADITADVLEAVERGAARRKAA